MRKYQMRRISGQPERIIQNNIIDLLRSWGLFCWSNKYGRTGKKNVMKRGVSDILGLTRSGRFFAIECKTETGLTSDEQRDFLATIRSNNGIAIVARCVQDIIDRKFEFV